MYLIYRYDSCAGFVAEQAITMAVPVVNSLHMNSVLTPASVIS